MIIGIANSIGHNRGGQGYSEAVQAYVDKLTALGYTQPDSTFLSALDTLLVTPLETGTVYSRMKTGNIYGFGSIEAGTVNLKDPDTHQHTLVSSPTFSAGNGVKSNGTSYINTNYKTNQYAGIETDLTTVVYVSESNTSAAGSQTVFGALTDVSKFYMIRPFAGGTDGVWYRFHGVNTVPSSNHKGLYVTTHDGTSGVIYKDGAKRSVAFVPTAPAYSTDILFLARNNATSGVASPTEFYTRYAAALFHFNRFSDTDESRWRTGFNTFKTAVGLP